MNHTKNKLAASLLSMFPNPESFEEFKNDVKAIAKIEQAKVIANILRYAKKEGVIDTEKEGALIEFIQKNRKNLLEIDSSEGITFKYLLDAITIDGSVTNLLDELNKIAANFGLLSLQPSMFTRLKKEFAPNTATKRNCLRIMAYWLGENKPSAGWHYEKLIKLGDLGPQPFDIDTEAGVRIAFNLQGKGNFVSLEAVSVTQLEKELKKCIGDLGLYHIDTERQIKRSSTALFLNIHKESGILGEPRLYERAIRDTMALSHQITTRWSLHCAQNKLDNLLYIGIAAGEYIDLDTSITALLTASLPENHCIRLTNFAYLCSQIADIKVVYYRNPREITLPWGDVITAWSVDCFWVFIYYDFIPELLEEGMLPKNKDSNAYKEFRNALYLPKATKDIKHKALSAIYQYPHDTLLILEIAKVCAARMMFHEAYTILSIALASKPRHVVIRTFRLFVLLNMALEQTDFEISVLFFERVIKEGKYIQNQCDVEEEEFFCEFGVAYLGFALRIFTILRRDENVSKDNEYLNKEKVFKLLKLSLKCFQTGRVIAPTGIGNRSIYWQVNTMSLVKMLKQKDINMFKPKQPLVDKNNIWEKTATKFYTYLGWLDVKEPDMIEKRINEAIKIYEGSVSLRTYIPNIKYAFAQILYDLSPQLTVGIVKTVINLLKQARSKANEIKQANIAIYSIATCFSQLQSAGEFIRCVDRSIDAIKDEMDRYFKDEEEINFLNYNDNHLIERGKLSGMKLMLLNMDEIY